MVERHLFLRRPSPPQPAGRAIHAMARRWAGVAAMLLLSLTAPIAQAAEGRPLAADPQLEARVMTIATELRCLVCQNQTVADSHSELAGDLRQQIREQLAAGRTDDDVRRFMTERYGDFVLYNPPFATRTALLWFGPGLLLLGSLAGLAWTLRRRQRLADDAFDPADDELSPPH